ncbi:hypothetical protein KC320_g176 [Hortaea werneckii]|nr:hypothetical protein KC320_g176 [Hortaea werneckii]
MAVVADGRISHMILDSQCLVYEPTSLHTSIGAPWAKPFVVGIIHDDQASRCDQSSQLMVIKVQQIRIISESAELDRLPHVFRDDLRCNSCGIVRARRSSKAPATKAPFPLRLHPVIASFFGSIPIWGLASKASMMRETPHDHATIVATLLDTLTLKLIWFPPLPVVMITQLVALKEMNQFFATTCPLLFRVYVPAVFELERYILPAIRVLKVDVPSWPAPRLFYIVRRSFGTMYSLPPTQFGRSLQKYRSAKRCCFWVMYVWSCKTLQSPEKGVLLMNTYCPDRLIDTLKLLRSARWGCDDFYESTVHIFLLANSSSDPLEDAWLLPMIIPDHLKVLPPEELTSFFGACNPHFRRRVHEDCTRWLTGRRCDEDCDNQGWTRGRQALEVASRWALH